MPRTTIEVAAEIPKTGKEKGAIKRIKWKGEWMLKQESFLATVREIANHVEDEDFTKIGIIGKSGSGKSTLADAIGHGLHTESDLPWAIKRFTKDNLFDFEKTLQDLTPTNHILIFDDLSFLEAAGGRKKIKVIEQVETEIRHLPGGKDVKIVLIYNYHYTKGLDKFLRQADFRYFTTVGSEERDNMESIVGHKWMGLVNSFTHCKRHTSNKDSKYSYFKSPRAYNKQPFLYKLRNPFIPVLYWNNDSLRFIISPTRQWMAPMCTTCTATDKDHANVDIVAFNKKFHEDFNEVTRRAVIVQLLREKGIDCGTKPHMKCRRYVEDAFLAGNFDLEQLALSNNVNIKVTKNRKKAVVKIDESARSAI